MQMPEQTSLGPDGYRPLKASGGRWRNVIIWGAAAIGERCLALLVEHGVPVLHFIDARPPDTGLFLGLPVHPGGAYLEGSRTVPQADAIVFAMRSDSKKLRDRLREHHYGGEFATFHGGTAEELFGQPLPLTAQDPSFIGLADQEPLSTEDMQRARQALARVRNLLDLRSRSLLEGRLDGSVGMPAANWEGGGSFYALAFRLLEGRKEDLELLRILSQQFSGYALWCMANAESVGFPPLDRVGLEAHLGTITLDYHIRSTWKRLREELPAHLRFGPPANFGEIGWRLDGVIVNYDLIAYWERLVLLFQFGFLDSEAPRALHGGSRVLEIGGGYGALAWYLQKAVPGLSYTILDLPESLVYSSIYLEVLNPGATRFMANYQFEELVKDGEEFDLVINTLSMSEMSEAQVRSYCGGLGLLLRGGGAFFEQNQDNRHAGMLNAKDLIAEYLHLEIEGGGRPHGFPNVWTAPGRQVPA